MPLEVNNDSDVMLTIQVEPVKPEAPIGGYESIPSAAWVKISPVDIFAHTSENDTRIAFMNVKLGLKGRLLFTIAPVLIKPSSQQPASVNLNFKITPERFEVSNVSLGEKKEVLTYKQTSAEIENFGSAPLDISVESLHPAAVGVENEKYAPCPDPKFLTFERNQITVPGKSKAFLKMWLEIPDRPEYRDKQYLFLVSVANAGSQMSGRRHVRLYVKTGSGQSVPKTGLK
jgi:hypothetical protein